MNYYDVTYTLNDLVLHFNTYSYTVMTAMDEFYSKIKGGCILGISECDLPLLLRSHAL